MGIHHASRCVVISTLQSFQQVGESHIAGPHLFGGKKYLHLPLLAADYRHLRYSWGSQQASAYFAVDDFPDVQHRCAVRSKSDNHDFAEDG